MPDYGQWEKLIYLDTTVGVVVSLSNDFWRLCPLSPQRDNTAQSMLK